MAIDKNIDNILGHQPILSTPNAEQLQLLVGYQAKDIFIGKNIDPSYIITKAKISFDQPVSSWDQLSLSGKHHIEVSRITIFNDNDGVFTSMEDIESFFEDTEFYLPNLRSRDIEDWPLLLTSQIQRICELKEITPFQILSLFSIIYTGPESNSWDTINWKDSIVPVFLMVTISDRGSIYDN